MSYVKQPPDDFAIECIAHDCTAALVQAARPSNAL